MSEFFYTYKLFRLQDVKKNFMQKIHLRFVTWDIILFFRRKLVYVTIDFV